MPSTYLIAVCEGSSLDSQSNNWTLYSLIEEVQLKPAAVNEGAPIILPLQLHVYWQFSPAELGP